MSCLEGKVILLTGGTGSFGQSFVTEALKHNPKAIRIYSRGELRQVEMERKFNTPNLRFFIGDIRDRERLDAIMIGVDYVVHAAALKHVSIGERNPQELTKTNVIGSINVIDMAARHKVKKVLALSTDKAVYPISAYGASKCLMEHLFKDANLWSAPNTLFSCIRSGNFWGSSGSVIPLWEEQSKQGEINVTLPQMSRYWIKLPDIAQFAIRCLDMMQGAEIFIPPVFQRSLSELALELHPDSVIKVTGCGEHEKVNESLFSFEEEPKVIKVDDYSIIRG